MCIESAVLYGYDPLAALSHATSTSANASGVQEKASVKSSSVLNTRSNSNISNRNKSFSSCSDTDNEIQILEKTDTEEPPSTITRSSSTTTTTTKTRLSRAHSSENQDLSADENDDVIENGSGKIRETTIVRRKNKSGSSTNYTSDSTLRKGTQTGTDKVRTHQKKTKECTKRMSLESKFDENKSKLKNQNANSSNVEKYNSYEKSKSNNSYEKNYRNSHKNADIYDDSTYKEIDCNSSEYRYNPSDEFSQLPTKRFKEIHQNAEKKMNQTSKESSVRPDKLQRHDLHNKGKQPVSSPDSRRRNEHHRDTDAVSDRTVPIPRKTIKRAPSWTQEELR